MLKEEFEKTIKKSLQKELEVSSSQAVPQFEKIVVNMGIGKMRENKKFVEEAIKDLTQITGQSVSKRKAKVSISNFKLRKGQLAGLSVTLRGNKMWDFYEKLVTIVLPRVKDFRGVTRKSFDDGGNYNLGLEEHVVFSEIDPNSITFNKPLQVTINTTSKNSEVGYKLLKALKMPFND